MKMSALRELQHSTASATPLCVSNIQILKNLPILYDYVLYNTEGFCKLAAKFRFKNYLSMSFNTTLITVCKYFILLNSSWKKNVKAFQSHTWQLLLFLYNALQLFHFSLNAAVVQFTQVRWRMTDKWWVGSQVQTAQVTLFVKSYNYTLQSSAHKHHSPH